MFIKASGLELMEVYSTKKQNRTPRQKSVIKLKLITRPNTTMSTIVEESCENVSHTDSTSDRVSQNKSEDRNCSVTYKEERKNDVKNIKECTKHTVPLPDIEIT